MDEITRMVHDHDKQISAISQQLSNITEIMQKTVKITGELQQSVSEMNATQSLPWYKYLPHFAGAGVIIGMIGTCIVYVATNGLTPRFEQVNTNLNLLDKQYIQQIHAMDKRLALMEYKLKSRTFSAKQ